MRYAVLTYEDITTYTIRLVNGEKKLEESCVGSGKYSTKLTNLDYRFADV